MKCKRLLAVGMSSLIAVSIAHADLSSNDATDDSVSPMQPTSPSQLADNNMSGSSMGGISGSTGMSGSSNMGGMSGSSNMGGMSGSSNMNSMSGTSGMSGMSGMSGSSSMSGTSSSSDEGSLDTATGDDY